MKKLILLSMLTLWAYPIFSQVTENDLANITFQITDDGKGGKIYNFFNKGKGMVGPTYYYASDTSTLYSYFDINGILQKVQIAELTNGSLLLQELKDGKKHGRAFQMKSVNLEWARIYDNNNIKEQLGAAYIEKKYIGESCVNGDCVNDFGLILEKEGDMAFGFFENSQLQSPCFYTYKETLDSYAGEVVNNIRNGFGIYLYKADGSTFIGMYKNGLKEGLGMWFNKDWTLKEKGYYKNDKLYKAL